MSDYTSGLLIVIGATLILGGLISIAIILSSGLVALLLLMVIGAILLIIGTMNLIAGIVVTKTK